MHAQALPEQMPRHVEPMLARTGALPEGDGWGFEVKWDGVRAVCYWDGEEVSLESRNLNEIARSYPELAELGHALGDGRAVLDGEIVAFDETGNPSFGRLQRRMHVAGPSGVLVGEVPVTYMIFDVLYLNERTTMGLPYGERRELLEDLGLEARHWRTPSFPGASGDELLAVTAEHGLEGIVAKRLGSSYRPGARTGDWLKIKNSRRQELVIGGWLPGRGRRSEQIGALLLGYHEGAGSGGELRYAGRVGSGFDDSDLELLAQELKRRVRDASPFSASGVQPPREARFAEPELVAEVEFSDWTKDGILRHSVYMGLRDDKRASAVVRESLEGSGGGARSGHRPESQDAAPQVPSPAEERMRDATALTEDGMPAATALTEDGMPAATALTEDGMPAATAATEDGMPAATPTERPGLPYPYKVLQETKTQAEVEVEGRRLKVSNRTKVLYPQSGFTKGDLIDYMGAVAPVLLPHLKGRQLTLKRYPDGVEGKFFYEKRCPPHKPVWVQTVSVSSSRQESPIDYCMAEDLPTLIWLGNLADIELHTSLHLGSDQGTPTMLVLDLDPGAPAGLRECCRVALWIREMFASLGLELCPKSSGLKGMQVYLPLNSTVSYAQTKPFAKALAELLERQHPRQVISRQTRSARAGKVLIDWSQNDPNKTTVSVYSLRAAERPMVSTPLCWEEVERASRARSEPNLSAEPRKLLARVERFGDLFRALLDREQVLPELSADGLS